MVDRGYQAMILSVINDGVLNISMVTGRQIEASKIRGRFISADGVLGVDDRMREPLEDVLQTDTTLVVMECERIP